MLTQGNREGFSLDYRGNIPELEVLKKTVDEIWNDTLANDSATLSKLSVDRSAVPANAPYELRITQGADPLAITLTVMAASTALGISKVVLIDLWKEIILREIKRRRGITLHERETAL